MSVLFYVNFFAIHGSLFHKLPFLMIAKVGFVFPLDPFRFLFQLLQFYCHTRNYYPEVGNLQTKVSWICFVSSFHSLQDAFFLIFSLTFINPLLNYDLLLNNYFSNARIPKNLEINTRWLRFYRSLALTSCICILWTTPIITFTFLCLSLPLFILSFLKLSSFSCTIYSRKRSSLKEIFLWD